MARDWVETFKAWAKPPSDTEEAKASRAARMVKDAVQSTGILDGRSFDVYPTGSYRNNTNVRLGSDVDIAVVLRDRFFFELPEDRRPEEFGISVGGPSYGLAEFRRDLGRALITHYGEDVTAGNVTFDVAGNTGRLPADATPFLRHRRYTGRRTDSGTHECIEGVETRPANGPARRIINFHDQHYERGVAKNDATGRRYKRVARILKKVSADMEENGSAEAKRAAEPVPSFLIECLVYNCPDTCFNLQDGSYYEDVKAVVTKAWNQTKEPERAEALVEVSGLKALFGARQKWTRQQAHEFLRRAWRHVGFSS